MRLINKRVSLIGFRFITVVIIILSGLTSLSQQKTADDYVVLYKQQTKSCKEGGPCCVRRLQCALGIYTVIKEDVKNGEVEPIFNLGSTGGLDHFKSFILKINDDFLDKSCPRYVQLSFDKFKDTFSQTSSYIEKTLQSVDIVTGLWDSLIAYIDMNPDMDENILICDEDISAETSDDKQDINNFKFYTKVIKSSIIQNDFIAAKIYSDVYLNQAIKNNLNGQQAIGLIFQGDVAAGNGNSVKAKTFYLESAAIAQQINLPKIELEAYQSLLSILIGEETLKERLKIHERLIAFYKREGNVIAQADEILLAIVLIGRERKSDTDDYLNEAILIYQENEAWEQLGFARTYQIAQNLDNNNFELACKHINELDKYFKDKKLKQSQDNFQLLKNHAKCEQRILTN